MAPTTRQGASNMMRSRATLPGSAASCEICQDLNTLYEADLPQFTSRMEGKGYH